MMRKIINEFAPLKDGRYILTLDQEIPSGRFNKYRIDGKDYEMIHVHVEGEFLLRVIGIKAENGESGFIGKEVEFICDENPISENIAV